MDITAIDDFCRKGRRGYDDRVLIDFGHVFKNFSQERWAAHLQVLESIRLHHRCSSRIISQKKIYQINYNEYEDHDVDDNGGDDPRE